MSNPATTIGLMLPSMSLWRREMVRFFRQRSRVVGAFATPMIFWLLLGSGLNNTFAPGVDGSVGEQVGYMEYFFPGTIVMIVMFTAIFSTHSVIEDRREGFMQAVLVAPVPRMSIVLGKVLGGASIATIQGVLFLLAWPLVAGVGYTGPVLLQMLLSVPVMFVLGIGLTGLGLCLAWKINSAAGFHAIMNLFLLPMWFLCGAVFPVDSAPAPMRVLMWANPLTYGQATFTSVLTGKTPAEAIGSPGPEYLAPVLMLVFTVLILLWATSIVSRPRKDGLP